MNRALALCMKNILKSKSGETLIEAIVAVSVLLLVMGPASAMIVSSSRTISQNRNDLIAAALAEEGLEIMKNIRDTNMVRFAQKSDECWNTLPDKDLTLSNCADAANKIGAASLLEPRILNLLTNPDSLQWTIGDNGEGVPVVPEPTLSNYQLSYDIATAVDAECPSNAGCHTHTGMHFRPDDTITAPLPRGELSPFYRQVQIQYLDFNNDETVDPVMKVTSKVLYLRAGGMREIKRILFLTNKPVQ